MHNLYCRVLFFYVFIKSKVYLALEEKGAIYHMGFSRPKFLNQELMIAVLFVQSFDRPHS